MTLTLELLPAEEAALAAQSRAHNPAMSAPRHADLIHRLQASGLLTQLPTHPGQLQPFQPITVIGLPVSQTIIEDREPH